MINSFLPATAQPADPTLPEVPVAEQDDLPINWANGVRAIRINQHTMAALDIPDLPGSACNPENAYLFHPDGAESRLRIAEAKAICGGCPVKQKCLDWCLQFEARQGGIQGGIWGGTTEWERREAGQDHRDLCGAGLHEFTGRNVVAIGNGYRRCRACHNKANREGKAARRARLREVS